MTSAAHTEDKKWISKSDQFYKLLVRTQFVSQFAITAILIKMSPKCSLETFSLITKQALMGKHSLPSPTSSGLIWGDVRRIIELLSHFLDDSQKLDFNWMRLSRYDKTHSTEIFPLSEGRPGLDGGGGQRGQRGGGRSDQPGRSGGTGGTPTLDGSDGRTYGTGHCQATLSLA